MYDSGLQLRQQVIFQARFPLFSGNDVAYLMGLWRLLVQRMNINLEHSSRHRMSAHLKSHMKNGGSWAWMNYISWDSVLTHAQYGKNESPLRGMQVPRKVVLEAMLGV